MVRTRGDLAVRLPGLVVGPEEETTEVMVRLDSDVETGDIYVGGTGGRDRYFKEYDMHFEGEEESGAGVGFDGGTKRAPTALIETGAR